MWVPLLATLTDIKDSDSASWPGAPMKSCVHLQWRVVFIHDEKALIAYDVMTHDEVALWLRGQRK